MVIIRKKKFHRASYICRLCGARPGGDPKIERTICSCYIDGINGEIVVPPPTPSEVARMED